MYILYLTFILDPGLNLRTRCW